MVFHLMADDHRIHAEFFGKLVDLFPVNAAVGDALAEEFLGSEKLGGEGPVGPLAVRKSAGDESASFVARMGQIFEKTAAYGKALRIPAPF